MRSRDKALFDWNIETAHYSSALCHLANISQQLGTRVTFAGIPEPFQGNQFGNESFERMGEHLKANGIGVDRASYRLGRELEFDPATERFIGDDQANHMLKRTPRPPFVIPDKA